MITTRIAPSITADPLMIDAKYVQLISVDVSATTEPTRSAKRAISCTAFMVCGFINSDIKFIVYKQLL